MMFVAFDANLHNGSNISTLRRMQAYKRLCMASWRTWHVRHEAMQSRMYYMHS